MEGMENREGDSVEIVPPFLFKGYEVTVVKSNENDKTPAWSNIDARSGKRIILVTEGIPKKFLIPILEHEVYEIEHGMDHEAAVEIGRVKAKELGILDDFMKFESEWNEIKEQKKDN